VVASCEVPFPSLDSVLPPFLPADHNLTIVTSHFEDIGPLHDEPPALDLVSLGLAEPIASIMNSVQHVSQLVPTHDAYPTAETSGVVLTRMCTLLSHLLSLHPILASSPEGELSALITESIYIRLARRTKCDNNSPSTSFPISNAYKESPNAV
jgi:hypothetical protein